MYTRFRVAAAFLAAAVCAAPAIHSQSPRAAGSTAPLPATFDVMEKSIPELQQSMQSGAVIRARSTLPKRSIASAPPAASAGRCTAFRS
jgi:hypothetical protein